MSGRLSGEKQFLTVLALYDYIGSAGSSELSFSKGDLLTVVKREDENWWQAKDQVRKDSIQHEHLNSQIND